MTNLISQLKRCKNAITDSSIPNGANLFPTKETRSFCSKFFVGNSKINKCSCCDGLFHSACLKSHLASCHNNTMDDLSDSDIDESVVNPPPTKVCIEEVKEH